MGKISEWELCDQPIHKFQQKGRQALSDTEILSLIIGSGTKTKNSLEVSKTIMSAAEHNFNTVARMSVKDFTKVYGIGKSKAIAIMAAFELGNRRALNDAVSKPKISASRDIFEIFSPILSDLTHEEFWIILLNRGNRILTTKQISSGGVSGTVVDPKIVFNFALEHLASSVILCHNHPSQEIIPSEADNRLTKKIVDCGKLLDIVVLDHLIIGGNRFYSWADEGKL